MSINHDLSTIAQAHLAPTQFASTSLILLCGKHNFTYRLRLSTLYKGRPTLAMKYSISDTVLSASEILSAMKRQTFEAEALDKIWHKLDYGALATVPEPHHFDGP
ncbi:hypothetical protein C8J57DRAFT_1673284 [Mycena rebaudengoi]|nr:hypothetical protein C8J57DRAFT_1673284 [Mycena rebaudengoi]